MSFSVVSTDAGTSVCFSRANTLVTCSALGAPDSSTSSTATNTASSHTEGQQYQVSANITVTPPVEGSNIIIQGMDLIVGSINGGVVPGSARSKFTIVGSTIRNGYVNFYTNARWELNMMQDSILGTNPYIYMRFGKLIAIT